MILRVSENMPLYDILNEFQKGHSHIAVVYKDSNETKEMLQKMKEGTNVMMQNIAGFIFSFYAKINEKNELESTYLSSLLSAFLFIHMSAISSYSSSHLSYHPHYRWLYMINCMHLL